MRSADAPPDYKVGKIVAFVWALLYVGLAFMSGGFSVETRKAETYNTSLSDIGGYETASCAQPLVSWLFFSAFVAPVVVFSQEAAERSEGKTSQAITVVQNVLKGASLVIGSILLTLTSPGTGETQCLPLLWYGSLVLLLPLFFAYGMIGFVKAAEWPGWLKLWEYIPGPIKAQVDMYKGQMETVWKTVQPVFEVIAPYAALVALGVVVFMAGVLLAYVFARILA